MENKRGDKSRRRLKIDGKEDQGVVCLWVKFTSRVRHWNRCICSFTKRNRWKLHFMERILIKKNI